MPFKKLLLFSLFMSFITIGILEGFLLLICKISPKINLILSRSYTGAAIDDEVLRYRPNPAYIEHDAKGFRNKSVPKKVEIVCIGDSQTYGMGIGVPPEDAWPQQLDNISGRTTYNMAFAGYGPTQYLYLLDEAIAMKPRGIIVGFYAGNDLYDVFCMVYKKNKCADLKNADIRVINAIDELENEGALLSVIENNSPQRQERIFKNKSVRRTITSLFKIIPDYSKIFGIFRALGRLTVNNRTLGVVADFFQHPFSPAGAVYDNGKFRTIFSVRERLLVLNLNDTRISESFRIALESLRLMREKALKNDIAFYVLLIPTKELVFKDLVYRDWETIPGDYKALIENEENLFAQTKSYLSGHSIAYFEALPSLRESLRNGKQPYSVTKDGHPNIIGYYAIAQLISDSLTYDKVMSGGK